MVDSYKLWLLSYTRSMVTVQSLTLAEFLQRSNLEASPAWEFFQGQAQLKPMPTVDHSIIQKRLTGAIDRAESSYEAFPELRCTLREQSVVPDITIIRGERVPVENTAISGAPDWMIEILSPDQSTTALISKIQLCLQAGTQLGWLVDSTEKVIMVFFPDERMILCRGEDVLPVLEGIELQLTANQVFSWLLR
ncbi:Uma2 family endonuclease [Roseofilum sp. BLCC_M154]|uniref:Uma2 family endonuclease n=1 Tax=Roseofilum acuticapitatum BLCC-M154 TaxID=3022444 RepID=A0ABT7AMA6_9CYAN|nr:Uma2 family endonuclease [Roseofilum acuticapitatum]MDJ1168029.1 Uma2 family endonuclease [Roseofilum acuticapitatum BLCC-M154]